MDEVIKSMLNGTGGSLLMGIDSYSGRVQIFYNAPFLHDKSTMFTLN
ncbi:hypothetical protein [Flavobacterium gillisiae]|nr:hypothetical protein [Flavobacterium gillisiae]